MITLIFTNQSPDQYSKEDLSDIDVYSTARYKCIFLVNESLLVVTSELPAMNKLSFLQRTTWE